MKMNKYIHSFYQIFVKMKRNVVKAFLKFTIMPIYAVTPSQQNFYFYFKISAREKCSSRDVL